MPTEWNLVHRESLLQQLVDGLKKHEAAGRKLSGLKVTFWSHAGEKLVEIFSLGVALGYLVNDIYWDETCDWRYANRLTVETY